MPRLRSAAKAQIEARSWGSDWISQLTRRITIALKVPKSTVSRGLASQLFRGVAQSLSSRTGNVHLRPVRLQSSLREIYILAKCREHRLVSLGHVEQDRTAE